MAVRPLNLHTKRRHVSPYCSYIIKSHHLPRNQKCAKDEYSRPDQKRTERKQTKQVSQNGVEFT